MEIEKKFLVKYLPDNLDDYEKWEIEQSYISTQPVIRLRKKNDSYILTIKQRKNKDGIKLNISEEFEIEIEKSQYDNLLKKIDGITLSKTRYLIPYDEFTIELDVFKGEYDGFYLAEVEFKDETIASKFVAPEWFGEDVSGDYHYGNNYMAMNC